MAPVDDLFIKDARVLCCDFDDTGFERASISIVDGELEALAPDLIEPPERPGLRVIDGTGLLAMPGLINGHYQSPGNFARGAIPGLPLELFMLYAAPPLVQTPASSRFAYVRTMLGIAEMLRQGVTSVHDAVAFLPTVTPAELNSVMKAYVDGGMRAAVALDQPNVVEYEKYPFLEEILPARVRERLDAAPRMSDDELLDCYEDFVARWHGAARGRVNTSVSCSAPQRVTPEYLQELGDISQRYKLPYNMHLLETRLERVLGEERLGRSLVRYVHDLGVLNERTLAIDSIWVDDDDIELMAESGCSVAHNPIANLKLGSGVMPFRRLRDAGINVCLGTGEGSASDGVNMWTALKLAGLIHNVAEPDFRRWPRADELLGAATAAGAVAMRLGPRTGQLVPGLFADVILIDLDQLPFVPLNDIRRQLVYCEPAHAVKLTIVGGEVVMEDGRILGFDEKAIKAEAGELVEEHLARMVSRRADVEELAPFYDQMYERANEEDVPMNRWAGPMTP
jgi:cytosine/adenosine deaminase-related metal-dependent hydrolase